MINCVRYRRGLQVVTSARVSSVYLYCFGGVAHLHGYTVAEDNSTTRKFGFQLVPPERSMRVYQFAADNETELRR